jgi:serine/threonine protein kinase
MIRYQLYRFLGGGGGGDVYQAYDLIAGIEVAIKIFHNCLDRTKMMQREIASLRAYSHPNIVKFLGTAMVDDAPAIVLELAEKGELSRYLREPLTVRTALALGRQIADALCEIHELGGVHGDVKPPNIFVNAGGGLKLGDFSVGNAKGCTVLFSAVAGGTPGYVAPEVARGNRSTPASDVYSFGVTLFEMLTARRPATLCGTSPSPGTIELARYRRDIPEGLSKLIQLATSVTPASRPTARGFQRELDRILGFLNEADARQKRMPVLRVLRAKVRPFGKGMQGLHGLPFVVRGEYFDFVTQSPWHPDHRLQVYHAATNASGRFPQKIGKPFAPSFAIPADRTIRVFMGNAPQGGERFSPDPTDQLGFDYQIFLGCGHVFSDRSSDGIFLVDTLSNQTVDVGVYEEIPRAGDLLVRVILQRYLPVPTARPVGLPVVRALPGR